MGKIDIYKPHEEDKLRKRKWNAPRYYDYPDGQDLLGKLNYTTKIAFYGSSFFGIVYSSTFPIPPTYTGQFLRYLKFVVPAVGMAATFTLATYYATNFRKKDDEINYAIGGALAGLVLAPCIGHPHAKLWAPVYLAALGMMKKSCQLEGKTLVPDKIRPRQFSSYFLRKDGTLLSDPVGSNWTREPAN